MTHSLGFHVEVRQRRTSTARVDVVKRHVAAFVAASNATEHSHFAADADAVASNSFLAEHVEHVAVCERTNETVVHVYQYCEDEEACVLDAEDDVENSGVASTATLLPSPALEGLWESLVFEGDVLSKLLNYVSTSV
ncbi:Pachytene checkpoint protein 2, partial [Rhizoclosmatium hyalinum]